MGSNPTVSTLIMITNVINVINNLIARRNHSNKTVVNSIEPQLESEPGLKPNYESYSNLLEEIKLFNNECDTQTVYLLSALLLYRVFYIGYLIEQAVIRGMRMG